MNPSTRKSICFLAICLLLVGLAGLTALSGCFWDDCEHDDIELFYVNNSGVAVNLIVVMQKEQIELNGNDTTYTYFTRTSYKHKIKNNDTLCNGNLRHENCAQNPWGFRHYDEYDFIQPLKNKHGGNGEYDGHDRPLYYKIEFLGEPKTCLVFDGDKVDNDIRYWENYILIGKMKSEYNPCTRIYHYYITSEQRKAAKEEHCL